MRQLGACLTMTLTPTRFDRGHLRTLIEHERERYLQLHPRSAASFADATHLFGRVPMTWMAKWSRGFPQYLDQARGASVLDVDGHRYADFALGDTGAMAGHSPAPVAEA